LFCWRSAIANDIEYSHGIMRSAICTIIVIVNFTVTTPLSNSNGLNKPVHTLLLCRHGNSIWNGGVPGSHETFTGWTDVPLSQRGIEEAKRTGKQVASYDYGIDACFTSILGRAQLTAHYCLSGFSQKDHRMEPRLYVSDYRLNERHYGALQGYRKIEVENGKYGHDPRIVKEWRRGWHAVPPLLEDGDPRRIEEIRKYVNYCGGEQNIPRGESLEMVAKNRIQPFLKDKLMPILNRAAATKDGSEGGTGLVVAHANSLRALIGVICNVSENPAALKKLEAMKIQTGVPLVLKYQQTADGENYRVCDLMLPEGDPLPPVDIVRVKPPPDLPVWPLQCLPLLRQRDNDENIVTCDRQEMETTKIVNEEFEEQVKLPVQ